MKVRSGVFAYPPFGMRIRRCMIAAFADCVEPLGYQEAQFTAIAPAQSDHAAKRYDEFACRLRSPYLANCTLLARSEEAIANMLTEAAPSAGWFDRAAVWSVSREFRASGGGRGFRRSVEYENLT